jgi:hypothetical protein
MPDLDVLVGEWDADAVVDGRVVATFHYRNELIEDGAFLMQRGKSKIADDAPQQWKDNAPTSSTIVIGADDNGGTYGYVYADSRGVRRVYDMSFDGKEWRIWGQSGPEFFQRFSGTLSEDANEIAGRWEHSPDGQSWELDFEATYKRAT